MKPSVSCICVSFGRPWYLKRAIELYKGQSYKNKELVIVYKVEDLETSNQLSSFRLDPEILAVACCGAEISSVCQMRNLGIDHATGDYVCIWDDDDWYHCERVRLQMEGLKVNSKPGTILTHLLIFDSLTDQLYFPFARTWEATFLLERKKIFEVGLKYDDLPREEDVMFVRNATRLNLFFPVTQGQLYIYNCTGDNLSGREHFDGIFKLSQRLPEWHAAIVKKILNGTYSQKEGSAILDSSEFLEALNYFIKSYYLDRT